MIIALLCGPLAASAADDKLSEASSLYLAGDNEKALAAYSAILTSSDADKLSPSFYYNYGTVASKLGNQGQAFVYLLRALAGKFWDGDTLHNVQIAEGKLNPAVRAIRPTAWISNWPLAAHFLPAEIWLIPILLSSAILLWVLGSGNRRSRAWAASLLFVLCFVFCLTGFLQSNSSVAGFVKQGQVKSGPGATFSNIVALEAGALVNVEESREGWNKIRFVGADLQEAVGWIEAGALMSLR